MIVVEYNSYLLAPISRFPLSLFIICFLSLPRFQLMVMFFVASASSSKLSEEMFLDIKVQKLH